MSESNTPYQVLGLNIGIGSLGWCLLDVANKQIVGTGVHLWETPQEPKTKISTATTRRAARSARRNKKRHANRMSECLKLLKAHGLIPEDATAASLQTVKGDLQPLEARMKALDEKLTDRELAQALYNLCNRRGYIPHGDGDASDPEGKRVLTAIAENSRLISEKGYRTAGEMMLEEGRAQGKQCGSSRNKQGNYSRCLTLEQLLSETDAIFEAQRFLENPNATDELQDAFKACMSWQKPTYDRDDRIYSTVGSCIYFLEEKRAPKACLSAERCAAYERLSNVRIVLPDNKEQTLTAEQREEAICILFSHVSLKGNKSCKFRYADIRKRLELPAYAYFKNIGAEDEKKDVYEPKAWRKLRSLLSEPLMAKLAADIDFADEVCAALTFASTEQSLRQRIAPLSESGRLTESDIAEICSLPYNGELFHGYCSRSLKALRMLNDAFSDQPEIAGLYDAEKATGLYDLRLSNKFADVQLEGKLPAYTAYDPTCSNPVVLRVMGRVRKLVNALIAKHGVPDEVHIELSRDLKRSAHEKQLIAKGQKRRKDANDASRKRIAESLGCDPAEVRGKLIRKVNLLNEQGERDVYTDEHISYERLIAEGDTYCQIGHILPYSRTCDDSQSNLVLALTKNVQDKGTRSPFEWLGDTDGWDAFKARVADLRLHGYPRKKAERLIEEHLADKQDDYIERNLNDTRYASVSALRYIEYYLKFPESKAPHGLTRKKRVSAVAGGATAILRHAWGFDAKDKQKDDLHNAVDAAIIAACREETVRAAARYSEEKHYVPEDERRKLLEACEPWHRFAKQVQSAAASVIPTRKVECTMTGAAFEDTAYRFMGLSDKGDKGVLYANGKEKKSGNYRTLPDGSTRILGQMMCLRLWWDPSLEVRGREVPGGYIAEPIYAADLPAIKNGTYVPRRCPAQGKQMPRTMWPVIDQSMQVHEPIVLFPGQCIRVNGTLCRYKTFGISSNTWVLLDPCSQFIAAAGQKLEPLKGLPISSIAKPEDLELVSEDILGECFNPDEELS